MKTKRSKRQLQKAIDEFCTAKDWCADGWKQSPEVKALFDLRTTKRNVRAAISVARRPD